MKPKYKISVEIDDQSHRLIDGLMIAMVVVFVVIFVATTITVFINLGGS